MVVLYVLCLRLTQFLKIEAAAAALFENDSPFLLSLTE